MLNIKHDIPVELKTVDRKVPSRACDWRVVSFYRRVA